MNTSAPLTFAHLSTFLGKKVKATINISDPKQYMLAMSYVFLCIQELTL